MFQIACTTALALSLSNCLDSPMPALEPAAPSPPTLHWLGRQDYLRTWEAMRAFTEQRTPDTPDTLWGVDHPPVFTLGQAGKPEHLLAPHDVPVVQTDRGGQVTYHGPGQAVVYLLLDIRRNRWMVRETVQRIEEAVIRTLARWNIAGERKPGAPGIYLAATAAGVGAVHPVAGPSQDGVSPPGEQRSVGAVHPVAGPSQDGVSPLGGQRSVGAKISALGLKVRNGCTYHGVAINVDMDLQPFDWINPCGYAGLRTADMAGLGARASVDEVAQVFAEEFAALWHRGGDAPNMTEDRALPQPQRT
jgi:lipoyl(octanoyl) transferase